MARKILLRESGLLNSGNTPTGYRYIGYDSDVISEKFGSTVSSIGGGSLQGTNYIYVMADGTPIENASELQSAYNFTKTQTPSITNRYTVIVGPGKYEFSVNFVLDTEYIDIVSLTGNRDVIFISGVGMYDLPNVYTYDTLFLNPNFDDLKTLVINTNNVLIRGIDVANGDIFDSNKGYSLKPLVVAHNLANVIIDNCKGGAGSCGNEYNFNYDKTWYETILNSEFGGESVGGAGGIFDGVVKDTICSSGYSFGAYEFNGSAKDCLAYNTNNFGGYFNGIAENCKVLVGTNNINIYSAGFGYDTMTGTTINCEAGVGAGPIGSFGGSLLGHITFTSTALAINCRGNSRFGGDAIVFYRCAGETRNCWADGGWNSVLTGKVRFCINAGGGFYPPSGGGIIQGSIDSTGFITQLP